MAAIHDDFIASLVKEKLTDVMERMRRERQELSPEQHEIAAIRLAHQEIMETLATRPDLSARLHELAMEHFLAEFLKNLQGYPPT